MKGQKKSHTREEKSEAIDIILANNEKGKLMSEDTEEPDLSDDDNHDLSNTGSTEKIAQHVCGKCHKTFWTISNFKKHLDFCRFSSNYHVRKAEMLKNLEKIEKDAHVMENTNVCFCCGESYDTYHFGQIKCSDCPKSFKTQLSYERHIFITHAEFDDHSCSICDAKLRSANLLKLHEDQHRNRSKPFACELCGKQFTRSNHVISHQKYSSCSATAVIECKFCNKSFQRIGKLRDHLKRQLCSQTRNKSENMCPVCKKCFQNSRNLKVHLRIHTGERPFDCDLCTKKFRVLADLQGHRRSHTGEKPYTCSVCKQSFVAKEVLNRHMKRHTGEKPHVCSECGKGFIRPSQLRSHTKLHIKPYGCDKCNKKFGTKKKLQSHVNKLHNKCKTCKIRFKTELEYNDHMKENADCAIAERRKRKKRTNKHNSDSVQSSEFHILKANQRDTEIFVNENPSKNCMNNTVSNSSPEVIKIQDSQGESFVTLKSKGKILNTNVKDREQQHVLKSGDNDRGYPHTSAVGAKSTIFLSNEESITVISLESGDDMVEQTNTKTLPNSKGKILNTNIEDLEQQHVLKTGDSDQGYPHTSAVGAKSTNFLSNEESNTVICLESDDDMVEQINTKTLPNNKSKILNTNIEDLKQQHVLKTGDKDQGYPHTSAVGAKSTIFLSNEESTTEISLESGDDMVEQTNTKTLPNNKGKILNTNIEDLKQQHVLKTGNNEKLKNNNVGILDQGYPQTSAVGAKSTNFLSNENSITVISLDSDDDMVEQMNTKTLPNNKGKILNTNIEDLEKQHVLKTGDKDQGYPHTSAVGAKSTNFLSNEQSITVISLDSDEVMVEQINTKTLPNNKGKILNTNIEDLKQQHVLKTGDNEKLKNNNVGILDQGYPHTSAVGAKSTNFLSNEQSITVISLDSDDVMVEQINTKTLPNNKGKILITNIEDLKQQHVLKTGDNEKLKNNNVGILDQGYPHTSAVGAKSTNFLSNEQSITVISLDSDDVMVEQINTKTLPNNKGKILNTNIEDLKQQHVLKTGDNEKLKNNNVGILDQGYPHTSAVGAKSTIFLSNKESTSVISMESDDDMVEQINTKTPESKIKKSSTLAADIADDKILETEVEPTHSEEDLKLKYNVRKLLDKLVDSATLKRFGWPNITEDIILCKLIKNCGYDLTKQQHKFSSFDYATRMRKYVKLFLTVFIQNEFVEELLNNDLIDEVIGYVLDIDICISY